MRFTFTTDWNFIHTCTHAFQLLINMVVVDHFYLCEEDHTDVCLDKCNLLCVSGKISAGRMQEDPLDFLY